MFLLKFSSVHIDPDLIFSELLVWDTLFIIYRHHFNLKNSSYLVLLNEKLVKKSSSDTTSFFTPRLRSTSTNGTTTLPTFPCSANFYVRKISSMMKQYLSSTDPGSASESTPERGNRNLRQPKPPEERIRTRVNWSVR